MKFSGVFSMLGKSMTAMCLTSHGDLPPRLERPGSVRPRSILAVLSAREVEIAGFVADGLSNKEIGKELGISHHTVSTHLRRVFSKLDLNCRIELCRVVLFDAHRSPSSSS